MDPVQQHEAQIDKRFYPPQHAPCAPTEAWTCTIQCPTLGTRSPDERIVGAPGVEVCKVVACLCAEPFTPHPTVSPLDVASDPTFAFVIFGAGYLLKSR